MARSSGGPRRPRAIVTVSGGLDSAVCLAEAVRDCDVAVLHANYGQRTQARELLAFEQLADHFGIEQRLVVSLDSLGAIGGSSLLDADAEVEKGLPVDGAPIPSTYVPFRNAHLLCVAVSWAEVIEAERIYIGAVEEDGSGYPDCRAGFYRAFEKAARTGTRSGDRLSIRTPLIELDKAAIVRRGLKLGAPLELTWSCYTASDLACGECESCALRLRGFATAGATDPIPYR